MVSVRMLGRTLGLPAPTTPGAPPPTARVHLPRSHPSCRRPSAPALREPPPLPASLHPPSLPRPRQEEGERLHCTCPSPGESGPPAWGGAPGRRSPTQGAVSVSSLDDRMSTVSQRWWSPRTRSPKGQPAPRLSPQPSRLPRPLLLPTAQPCCVRGLPGKLQATVPGATRLACPAPEGCLAWRPLS